MSFCADGYTVAKPVYYFIYSSNTNIFLNPFSSLVIFCNFSYRNELQIIELPTLDNAISDWSSLLIDILLPDQSTIWFIQGTLTFFKIYSPVWLLFCNFSCRNDLQIIEPPTLDNIISDLSALLTVLLLPVQCTIWFIQAKLTKFLSQFLFCFSDQKFR